MRTNLKKQFSYKKIDLHTTEKTTNENNYKLNADIANDRNSESTFLVIAEVEELLKHCIILGQSNDKFTRLSNGRF